MAVQNLGRVRLMYTDLTPEQKNELKGDNASIAVTKDENGNVVITGTDTEHGTTSQIVELNDMRGATASADGKSGAVPAPTMSDKDKYLKGDGTWQTINSNTMTYSTTEPTNPEENSVWIS